MVLPSRLISSLQRLTIIIDLKEWVVLLRELNLVSCIFTTIVWTMCVPEEIVFLLLLKVPMLMDPVLMDTSEQSHISVLEENSMNLVESVRLILPLMLHMVKTRIPGIQRRRSLH